MKLDKEKSMKKKHCCELMKDAVTFECNQHGSPFECPDSLIFYSLIYDEYGIIVHDGGASFREIHFCPWCGTKLPESKRDLWFDTLEEMGFDDPEEQDIPKEFHTDEWYQLVTRTNVGKIGEA